MKAEYMQKGDTLNYTNPTEDFIAAGTLVIFGDICGIAATDMAPGQLGTIATKGVWEMTKDAVAIDGGDKVYYDKAKDVVTATASITTQKEGGTNETTNNVFVGIATADAATSASTVFVRLNG